MLSCVSGGGWLPTLLSPLLSVSPVVRWQADPACRATRPEDRKRRGGATFYERVPYGVGSPRRWVLRWVRKVLLLTITGC
jgi:hypothetical protein